MAIRSFVIGVYIDLLGYRPAICAAIRIFRSGWDLSLCRRFCCSVLRYSFAAIGKQVRLGDLHKHDRKTLRALWLTF